MVQEPTLALFLDPGLGKTGISLIAIKRLMDLGVVRKVLVMAPLIVVHETWRQEAVQWSYTNDLTFKVLHGPKIKIDFDDGVDIHLINYSGLKKIRDRLDKVKGEFPYDMLVVDESSKFKDSSTKRFKSWKKLFSRFKRRYLLTATPLPQGLLNIWSQWFILDGGQALGTAFTRFRSIYFDNPYKYKWVLKPGAAEELTKIMDVGSIRLKAADYLDMPPIMYNTIKVTLPDNAREVYKHLLKDLIIYLESDEIIPKTAAVRSMKLRQLVQGAMYTESGDIAYYHQAKALRLKEFVETLETPVLVPVGFKFDYDIICKVFGKELPIIDGSNRGGNKAERDKRLVKAWNKGELPILLVHPASLSHGVNLQHGGSQIIWYCITWSSEQFVQFNARIYRQGQTKNVVIHSLIVRDSIDELVQKVLEMKGATQEMILQQLKNELLKGEKK
ncbi:MAG: ATP-dependent helicase [Chloroflexi bacterium]|nr:MAG: ATP-dependent helicase [Chloroflexota bacterium]